MQLHTRKLERINVLSLRYFTQSLQACSKAKKYIFSRISKQTAEKFHLGYAPKNGFIEYLNRNEVEEDLVKELGLVFLDYNQNAYPRFSDRIMLPIIHAGRLVGFGGRTLSGEEPKYLNSKTSVLYNKSEVLYGLWKTRGAIEQLGYCILVEGYFDVLTLIDNGIKNVVATCGTALTDRQIQVLKRYTERVYVMYDGDEAGRKAASKAKLLLKKAGIFAGNVLLPEGKDPADLIKTYGRNFKKYVKIKR